MKSPAFGDRVITAPRGAGASTAVPVRDQFSGGLQAGRVIGSVATDGAHRRGVDLEGVIGLDNGALRIQPLIDPGWGRAALTYGPFDRENGLTLAVYMLNGHNTSQSENLKETFRERLEQWWAGSQTWGPRRRLLQWVGSRRLARTLRQFRWWWHIRKGASQVPAMDENLAVGWFTAVSPEDPLHQGNAFVMHATGPENGELWATVAGSPQRLVRGIQNLPVYYVVVLRARGAAYYAASVEGARGLGVLPDLRPLAIDPFAEDTPVYPGLTQSLLGQIGFRLDTRVYGVAVNTVATYDTWYGSAHAADPLTGAGSLSGTPADVGGRWNVWDGYLARTALGATATETNNLVTLNPSQPSGLIHAVLDFGDSQDGSMGIVWRFRDPDNFWVLHVGQTEATLYACLGGVQAAVAASSITPRPAGPLSLQVLDDGHEIGCALQGRLLFDSWVQDERLGECTGVGLQVLGGSEATSTVRAFEAHPRRVPLPADLALGAPWQRKGDRIVIADDFRGPAGNLDGRVVEEGEVTWTRTIGRGTMALTGDGSVRIEASPARPNPGRTAYTLPWSHPGFADLEVTITPPGTERGQRQHGLCGFIFWQDDDNYITVNIWVYDTYEGASISCFFHVNGFEDLYDAIWSNVGTGVYFGRPLTLRMALDGSQYVVYLDGRPVLYRALKDVYADYKTFQINRVGLLANWEWGNDTGSEFRRFRGRV